VPYRPSGTGTDPVETGLERALEAGGLVRGEHDIME
jgi:hypothetical protein